jgi:hypothetical protein
MMIRHAMQWISVAALAAVFSSCGGQPGSTSNEQQTVSASSPFDMLDAYGTWTNLPERGQVWEPRVPYDWAPFTQGQWVWTDQGWMWNGDEPFAWVVYHYGSWDYQPGPGWYWVPGYDWSPARVSWCATGDYVGWAPMPPPGVTLPGPGVQLPEHRWSFVPTSEFGRGRIGVRRMNAFTSGAPMVDDHPPDVRSIETAGGGTLLQKHLVNTQVRAGTRELLRSSVPETKPVSVNPPPRIAPVAPVRNEPLRMENPPSPGPALKAPIDAQDRKAQDGRKGKPSTSSPAKPKRLPVKPLAPASTNQPARDTTQHTRSVRPPAATK